MTNNKSFVFLVIGSLLAGLGWLAAAWAGAGLAQVQTAVQGVARAEPDLVALKEQVVRWEQAGAVTIVSVEPVALGAKFAPGELPRSAQLLAGLYGEHGYFNLRHFVLSWGADGGAGAADGMANMTVEGEKIFLGQRAPLDKAAPAAKAAPQGGQS